MSANDPKRNRVCYSVDMRICSRREIVLGGVATAVALPFSPVAAERHTNPLKIPKLIDGVTGARKTFELDYDKPTR